MNGVNMLQNRPLTTAEAKLMIEQLDTIADRLFSAGYNTLGNSVQETVYCMEANLAEQLEAKEA
jgi:hypothetical protein